LLSGLEEIRYRDWAGIVRLEGFDGRRFLRRNVDLKDKWENLKTAVAKPKSSMPLDMIERVKKIERILQEGGIRKQSRTNLARPKLYETSDDSASEMSSSSDDSSGDSVCVVPQRSSRKGTARRSTGQSESSNSPDGNGVHGCDDDSVSADSREMDLESITSENVFQSDAVVVVPVMSAEFPIGLLNPDGSNRCWLNAAMQCLITLDITWNNKPDTLEQSLFLVLNGIRSRTLCDADDILWVCRTISRLRPFADNETHDALEFICKFISSTSLQSQCSFVGQYHSRCDSENGEHIRSDPVQDFFPFVVNMPQTGKATFASLLGEMFLQQRVPFDGQHSSTCEQCGATSRVEKLLVGDTPRNMIVRLRRETMAMQTPTKTRGHHANLGLRKSTCTVSFDSPTVNVGNSVYEIAAVLCHKHMHYTAKVRRDGCWYHCDDDNVSAITWSDVAMPSKDVFGVFLTR
jgi:hypothetical protein